MAPLASKAVPVPGPGRENRTGTRTITAAMDDSTARRTRKWATKTRTGCTTCRTRHIKCDETKPVCKQCLSTGRTCKGFYYEKHSFEPAAPALLGGIDAVAVQEPAPPDWTYMEGCRYYMDVQWPAHQQRLGHDVAKPRNLRIAHRAGVLVEMTSDYISRTTNELNQHPHPSATPALAPAWSTLYRYRALALNEVSARLEDPTPVNKGYAFLRICDVLSSELRLLGFSWRAHMVGFLNILKLDTIESVQTRPIIKRAMQFIITNAVTANTTCSSNSQIWEVYQFPTKELATMFSSELGSESPYPTVFFMAMNRISYLRAVRSAGAPAKSVMAAVQPTLDKVRTFEFSDWVEPYPIPEGPVFPLMLRVFRTSVLLYGCLSLCESQPGHQRQKVELRDELSLLIKEAARVLESRLPLAWPISVLAVALAGGPQWPKDLIEDILCNGPISDTFYVPQFRVKMLKRFWDSGNTGWDDCYFEPFPPLS